jgi:hypothetical protein
VFSSLNALAEAMRSAGARRFVAKPLAPNDNTKNQVYLGGGFAALNIIPHGSIASDDTAIAGAVRDRAKANVDFYWIAPDGLGKAPGVQLILYPKYPEVRMSGFLRGASRAPNELMASRAPGRMMMLGVCPDGRVIGHVSPAESPITREIEAAQLPTAGVFLRLTDYLAPATEDPLTKLLAELGRIHRLGAIQGKRLYPPPPGTARSYAAQNAGGYTLEAELGILPNGVSEPDFLGWEVKSFSVPSPGSLRATSATTLMTPEPTTGVYAQDFGEFMRRFGYDDTKGRAGRRNFGGVYRNGGDPHHLTGLSMRLDGFDNKSGKIFDLDGTLALVAPDATVAAGWRIRDLVDHWSRKHAQAVYVPVFSEGSPKTYRYGSNVELGDGTDAIRFLKAVSDGSAYLDPAAKIEGTKAKKRNQFRVSHHNLAELYDTMKVVAVI